MVSRLPCVLADGSLVVVISPGLKSQGIDVANAFVAPQRHGALCAALAPVGGDRDDSSTPPKQQQQQQQPACSTPKCKPSEHFGEWSTCTRGCGGGWTKRSWHRVTCADFYAPSTDYRCHACRPHAVRQEQSRHCNTKPCPCVQPIGDPRAQPRSWISDAERRQILRQMADLGVWLAGSSHCSESERQLRLCRQDAGSTARSAEPGLTAALCAALRARYRDCTTTPDAPPCRVAHELPTWVWLPSLDAGSSSSLLLPSSSSRSSSPTRTKPLTWRGFRGWKALQEIVDKVDAITTRLRVEAEEAHPAAPALIAATEPPAAIGIGNDSDDDNSAPS